VDTVRSQLMEKMLGKQLLEQDMVILKFWFCHLDWQMHQLHLWKLWNKCFIKIWTHSLLFILMTFRFSARSRRLPQALWIVLDFFLTKQTVKLCGKLSKWQFYQKSVSFLGHIVSEKGVEMVSSKVKAILDCQPQDQSNVFNHFWD